jgi:GH24 family phage-related lysozyme (muramidase)
MKEAGAYHGPIDGIWGPLTDAGITTIFKRAEQVPEPRPTHPIGAAWVNPQVALEIAHSEAVIREAYLDSGGTWTWSVGLTDATGHDVRRYKDNQQTLQHCMDVYVWALRSYCIQVDVAFAGMDLSLEAKAGAASFHWNTGAIGHAGWVPLYMAGKMKAAEEKFRQWHLIGGKPSKALAERRDREADLIWRGKWASDGMITEYQVNKAYRPSWASATRVDVRKELAAAFAFPQAVPIDETPEPLHVPEVPTMTPLVA